MNLDPDLEASLSVSQLFQGPNVLRRGGGQIILFTIKIVTWFHNI